MNSNYCAVCGEFYDFGERHVCGGRLTAAEPKAPEKREPTEAEFENAPLPKNDKDHRVWWYSLTRPSVQTVYKEYRETLGLAEDQPMSTEQRVDFDLTCMLRGLAPDMGRNWKKVYKRVR